MDRVLSRQPIGESGEEHDQGQVAPAQRDVGRRFDEGDPTGLETKVVGTDPSEGGQDQVPEEKPDAQDLAAALDHGEPRPWGRASRRHSPIVRDAGETWRRKAVSALVARRPESCQAGSEGEFAELFRAQGAVDRRQQLAAEPAAEQPECEPQQ